MMLSDVCMSVAYIGTKSRTERPRKTKIGTEVAHVTGHHFFSRSRSPPCWRVRRLQRRAWECVAVGNCCYVAVCSAAQGASAPTGRRGGGVSWWPPACGFLTLVWDSLLLPEFNASTLSSCCGLVSLLTTSFEEYKIFLQARWPGWYPSNSV